MTLGERIVFYRRRRNLTQKALADLMGISPTRLNYWEKDKREPDVRMINQLCRTLDVDPKYLLSDAEMPEEKTPPSPAEPDQRENGRVEVSAEALERMLQREGFIQPGEDLSDADLRFLFGVGEVISAWFGKGQQGGCK